MHGGACGAPPCLLDPGPMGGVAATSRPDLPELLTIGQVAELAGVSRWTVKRDVDAGRLPVHVVPGHPTLRRYRRTDVLAYLAGKAPEGGDETGTPKGEG